MTITSEAAAKAVGGQSATVSILLYSDNASVRAEVRRAVGGTLGNARVPVEWTEVATANQVMFLLEEDYYDLVIADNETTKCGGVALTRQLRNELEWQPTVLLLLARQQDGWLAAWAEADAALLRPADPFELRNLVTDLVQVERD
jgi:DNA-binding response OmpR family regulator